MASPITDAAHLTPIEVKVLRTLSNSRMMTPSSVVTEGLLPPDPTYQALAALNQKGYVTTKESPQLDEPLYTLTDEGRRFVRSRL